MIVYDEDAAVDEPTQSRALILVTASGRTDRGLRRKNNEDSLLALEDEGLFVIADGMGGYHGGEIASALAVQTIEQAFKESDFREIPTNRFRDAPRARPSNPDGERRHSHAGLGEPAARRNGHHDLRRPFHAEQAARLLGPRW